MLRNSEPRFGKPKPVRRKHGQKLRIQPKTLMNWFKRLHDRRVPPGLEVKILRKLPRVALFGSMIPVGLAVMVRVLPTESGVDAAKFVKTVDIFAIACAITFFTAVLTIAIGAVVVYIMKGPAYVADAYPVSHSDRPKREMAPRGEDTEDHD